MNNEEKMDQQFEEFMDALKGLSLVLEHLKESTQRIADTMQKQLLLKGEIDLNAKEEALVLKALIDAEANPIN